MTAWPQQPCCRILFGAELRTWTSKSGKFTVKAELLSFDQEVVSLRRTNGKTDDAKMEILAEGFDWSEGPVWVGGEKDGAVLFSDVPRNTIYRW